MKSIMISTRALEEARAELARLQVGRLPWGIKLDVHGLAAGGLEIAVSWSPIDVDTEEPTTITLHLSVRPGETILDAARRAVRVIALHEIDEQLLVDGVRRWEPHLEGAGYRRPIVRRIDDGT